jgi:hypothetical protein
VVATDPLANPAELAVWLGVPETDTKLLAALNAASRRFRGAVRHPVSLVAADTVTLDGTGAYTVLLPAAPVVAVASVVLDGTTLVDSTDYEWSQDGYLRRLSAPWPTALRCLTVTYTHGYAQVPEDIQEVVLDQARAIYTVQPGVQARTVGGQSVTFGAQAATGVTAQWAAAVEKYQLNRGDRA